METETPATPHSPEKFLFAAVLERAYRDLFCGESEAIQRACDWFLDEEYRAPPHRLSYVFIAQELQLCARRRQYIYDQVESALWRLYNRAHVLKPEEKKSSTGPVEGKLVNVLHRN